MQVDSSVWIDYFKEERPNHYVGMIEQAVMQLLDNPYLGKARPEFPMDLSRYL